MSDRIRGFDWDDCYLIWALSAGVQHYAKSCRRETDLTMNNIAGCVEKLCPHFDQRIKDAVVSAAWDGIRQEIVNKAEAISAVAEQGGDMAALSFDPIVRAESLLVVQEKHNAPRPPNAASLRRPSDYFEQVKAVFRAERES